MELLLGHVLSLMPPVLTGPARLEPPHRALLGATVPFVVFHCFLVCFFSINSAIDAGDALQEALPALGMWLSSLSPSCELVKATLGGDLGSL